MNTGQQGLSVIIPTLNEAENIRNVTLQVLDVARRNSIDNVEVIVVDDSSTDGTGEIVKHLQNDYPVRPLLRDGKFGLASATIAGAQAARYDVVLVMDADLSHPPEKVAELYRAVSSGEHDMAIGSRYIKGGATPDWPLRRKVVSRVATLLAYPFIDANDPMSGFFCVKKQYLAELSLETAGFKIGFEILARYENLRVAEVPIIFHDREKGESKLGKGVIVDYLVQLKNIAGGLLIPCNTAFPFIVIVLAGMAIDLGSFVAMTDKTTVLGVTHAVSFAIATFFYLVCFSIWLFSKSVNHHLLSRFLVLITVTLLAFSVRTGFLATLVQSFHLSWQVAIVPTIVITTVVQYLGCAFWVFPEKRFFGSQRWWRVFAFFVFGYSLLLRFVFLGPTELLYEEAYYWNYAQHLDIGYLDHPPMVAWLISVGNSLFGATEFGVRFCGFVLWFVTAFFVFGLGRNLFNKSVGVISVLMFATLPFYFSMGLFVMPDAPLLACWAGTLYFLERALIQEDGRSWYGAGVCVGLGLLSKYTLVLLMSPALLFLLLLPQSRKWLWRKEVYLASFIALLIFSPVIYWNATHEFVSFNFQGKDRINDVFQFSFHKLIGSILMLITPTGFLAVLGFYFKDLKDSLTLHSDGLLGSITKVISAADKPEILSEEQAVTSIDQGKRQKVLFGLLFSLFPLLVFIFFSLFRNVKLNWTGPLWLVLLPFISTQVLSVSRNNGFSMNDLLQKIWPPTILILLIGYGLFLSHITLKIPGLTYPEKFHLVGWRDLAAKVIQVEEKVLAQKGRQPIVVGMDKYSLTAQLSFYRFTQLSKKKNEGWLRDVLARTTGPHLFNWESLMFSFWHDKEKMRNKWMVLVDNKKNYLMSRDVHSFFKYHGKLYPLSVEKNGEVVNTFYYMVSANYRPRAKLSKP